MKLLVFPYPLSADYSIPQLPIFGVGDWQFLCSAAIWTCIVVDAIVLFQKAAKFEDSSSHAWSNLGKAWFVKGNMTEAAAAFRKAIAFDPKDPDALRFLPLIAKGAAGR